MTAEITDSSRRRHVIAIRYTIGDYFLADINKQIYCFKIEGERIETYRETLTKSFRVLSYTTKNYKPIAKGEVVLLGQVLAENSLPKVTYNLYRSLKLLGNMERRKLQDKSGPEEKGVPEPVRDFEPHDLPQLVKIIADKKNEYTEVMQNVLDFLDHLNVKQICTPVREVSEFLEGELIATDPKYLGDVISTLQRVDGEHKLVCNKPITGKMPWMKTLLVLTLVGVMCGAGYYLYTSGAFSNFSLGSMFGGGGTSQDIMKAYPTPEALKVAIAQGKVSESSLPPDIKREVDAIKLPATLPPSK